MNDPTNTQEERPAPRTRAKTFAVLGLLAGMGLAGVVLLLAVAFLNVDKFREPIVAGLSQATGLKVEIESLGLDFSRGLGFKCGGLRALTPDGRRELFSAEKLFLKLRLLPLLHRQISIANVALVKPAVQVYLDRPAEPAGSASHDGESPASDAETSPKKLAAQQLRYKNVKHFLKTANWALDNIDLQEGRIQLLRHGQTAGEKTINLSLRAQFTRPDQNRLDMVLKTIALDIGKIKIAGDVRAHDMLEPNAALRVNLKSAPFTQAELYELRGWMPENLRQSIEQKRFSGKFQRVALSLDSPLEPLESFESLINHAKAKINFLVEDAALNLDNAEISIPYLEGNGWWEDDKLAHEIRGKAFDGEFLATGTLSLKKDLKKDSPSALAIDSDIKASGVHIAKIGFPAPNEWVPGGGVVSGTLHAEGALSPAPELQWQGELKGKNIVLGTPEKRRSIEEATVSLTAPSSGPAVCDAKLSRIVLGDASLRRASGTVGISRETIRLTQGKIFPQRGVVDWTGNFRPATQRWEIKFASKELLAEDLLPEYFLGPANLEGNLNGEKTPEGPMRGLSGAVKIKLADGSFRKAGVLSALLALLNPHSLAAAQKEGLSYSYLGADFEITRGEIVTDNLEMDGPQLKIQVAGKADLQTGALKGEAKAMPLQLVDTVVKAIPLLGKILAGGKKGGLLETYFEIEGTLSEPKFSLLPAKSLLGKPARIIEELIKLPASLADSGDAQKNEGKPEKNQGQIMEETLKPGEG